MLLKKAMMERKLLYKTAETFRADHALIIVTIKVSVMLFFGFSEVKTQPCNFWRKAYDKNLYCSFSLPVRGCLMLKRCVLTLL